jgi:Circularly permutated YpsA SLOG family
LRETPSAEPAQRTRWNVRDSDATLVLVLPTGAPGSPGTTATELAATELGQPLLMLDALEPAAGRPRLQRLLATLPAHATLNVAGPRQSEAPGAYARVLRALAVLLG